MRWAGLPLIADQVAQNAELLARLGSANAGNPLAMSRDEVSRTVDTFRFVAGALRAYLLQPPSRSPSNVVETSDISINSPGASLVALHEPSPDRWPARGGSLLQQGDGTWLAED
ncbi:aldehyde dehydrogenase family protein [Streptomyces sp. NPDC101234]|uniref:aldehyde dehydrogenase family protein n=1 Tax=Streptomyces sp. NPDC101234 TaxID=3366138 RepID=UPI00380D8D39